MERLEYGVHTGDAAQRLALGLAWFSIGLGTVELFAPGTIARLIGVPDDDRNVNILRAMGAREAANGFAILAQPDNAAWLWSRVGGDAADLAYLASAMGSDESYDSKLALASAAVLGVAALDVLCARQLGRGLPAPKRESRTVHVEHAVTVNRPIEQVYGFWRNFENFPRFMAHLESVEKVGDRRSRWRAKGPAGTSFAWAADTVEEVENERIVWESIEGSDVRTRGAVYFDRAPGARGTEVRVKLEYTPPGGGLGRAVAWLFGEEPAQQVRDDLRRFKQIIETGEVVLSDGPGLWRPAQPAETAEQIRTLAGAHQ
jgi:uncharacterized membrane protein